MFRNERENDMKKFFALTATALVLAGCGQSDRNGMGSSSGSQTGSDRTSSSSGSGSYGTSSGQSGSSTATGSGASSQNGAANSGSTESASDRKSTRLNSRHG